ncbi:hypothetical protein CL653_00585, partial [bacterium]|nr:hypothetical protein [bacterium]
PKFPFNFLAASPCTPFRFLEMVRKFLEVAARGDERAPRRLFSVTTHANAYVQVQSYHALRALLVLFKVSSSAG